MKFPVLLGQVKFADPTYEVSVGSESVSVQDTRYQDVWHIAREPVKVSDVANQQVRVTVLEVASTVWHTPFKVAVFEPVAVQDAAQLQPTLRPSCVVAAIDSRFLHSEHHPIDSVRVIDSRLLDVSKVLQSFATVQELPHYFNVLALKPTESWSIVLRTDTLIVVALKVEEQYAMSVKRCWFVIREYDSSREVARRVAHYMDGKLILIDRFELPEGVYVGWFDIELDNGDHVTYPKRNLLIIVR